jgi:hypothetical protein
VAEVQTVQRSTQVASGAETLPIVHQDATSSG